MYVPGGQANLAALIESMPGCLAKGITKDQIIQTVSHEGGAANLKVLYCIV